MTNLHTPDTFKINLLSIIKILAGLVLLTFLFSCSKKSEPLTIESQAHRVQVYKLKEEKEYPEIKSFGSISFVNKADVTAVLDANIESISIREGDLVKQGTLLISLHNPQLDIRLKQAEVGVASAGAALSLSQAKYWEGQLSVEARLLSLEKQDMALKQKLIEVEELNKVYQDKVALFDVGGVSENALESAKSGYTSALSSFEMMKKDIEIKTLGLRDKDLRTRGYSVPKDKEKRLGLIVKLNTETLAAELAVAESRLLSAQSELESTHLLKKDLQIHAPISGIIGSVYLEQGERVSPGTKVITIFNSDSVYAVFPVQEKDILNIKEGMKVQASVDAYSKKDFSGKIDIISPIIDPQTGNFNVKAKILNEDSNLKPGMFVRTTIIMDDPRKVIRIPSSCLTQKRDNKARIYIVKNDRVFAKNIKIGNEKNAFVELLSPLDEGELIIDSPSPVLKEGDFVEIIS